MIKTIKSTSELPAWFSMGKYQWLDEYENAAVLTDTQKQKLLDQIALRLFIKKPHGECGEEISNVYWKAIVKGRTFIPCDFYNQYGINKSNLKRLSAQGWKDGLSNKASQLDVCRGLTVNDVKGITKSLIDTLSLSSLEGLERGSQQLDLNVNKALTGEQRLIGGGERPFYNQIYLDQFSNNEILSFIEMKLDQWRAELGVAEPNSNYLTDGHYKDVAKFRFIQYLDLEYWASNENKSITYEAYAQLFGLDQDPDKNKLNGSEILKGKYRDLYNVFLTYDVRKTGKTQVIRKTRKK